MATPTIDTNNLIVNGDFENNPVTLDANGNGFGFFDSIEGWTPITGQIEVQEGVVPTSDLGVAGNAVVELATDENVGIQQTVTIADGADGTFLLSLDHAQRSDDFSPAIFQIIIDGEVVATVTPESGTSNRFEIELDLDAGEHTIGFLEIGQSNGRGSLLDNVSLVSSTPPAGPVPQDLALMLADTEIAEDGATVATITRTGEEGIDQPLTVQIEISGSDEAAPQITEVTFAANQTSLDVPINGLLDGVVDGDQSVTVTVSAGSLEASAALIVTDINTPPPGFADTSGADTATGTAGAETLTLLDDGQSDTFDAAGGSDTLDVSAFAGGLTVDLGTQQTSLNASTAPIDTITNFENVIGGDGNDVFIGDTLSNTLTGGGGDDFITGGDEGSLTAEQAFVFRAYNAVLDRAPDPSGFNFFSTALEQGTITETGVLELLVNSAEFQSTFGAPTDDEFVELLYENALERSSDPSGFAFFTGQLEGGASRAAIVETIISGNESIATTAPLLAGFSSAVVNGTIERDVFDIFQVALGRQSDAGGIGFFAENILNGNLTEAQVLSTIVASAEFEMNFGSLSNTEFVENLYQNAFGRDADAAGLAFFVGQLDGGASVTSVITTFLNSAEFAAIPEDELDAFLLSITNNLTDIIIGGTGDDDLVGGIGGDTFVYDTQTGGQDRILDYAVNGGDVVDLLNTGITNLADLLTLATQDGPDAVFDFGGGNTLRLANVTLDELDADDFLFPNQPAPPPPSAGNLIINGGFENNPVTLDANGNGFGFFDAIEGWTPTFGQIEIQEGEVPTSDLGVAGNAVLELATDQNAGVEQTVTVPDGAEGVYTLSLDHAQRTDDFSPAIFNVLVDGVVVATITPESGTSNTFEIDLNLSAGEHTIGFEEIGLSNGRGSLIDNVALVATGQALPAPAGPELVTFEGEAGGRSVNLETGEWSAPLRILPLGDSITLGVVSAPEDVLDPTLGGYRDDLFNAFLGEGILIDYVGSRTAGPGTLLDQSHEGTSGIRADMLAANLPGQIGGFNPDIVLLMAGTNDSRQDPANSGQTTPQDLQNIINIVLGQNPDAQIFVSTIIPQEPDGDRNSAAIPAVAVANEGIVELVADLNAAGFDNIHLVDNSNLPLSLISDLGPNGINDVGLHPTEEGFAEIAQRWFDALNNVFDGLPDSLAGTVTAIDPGVQNIIGATGNDLLVGNNQANEIDGSAGNDIIDGGGGDDVLTGGSGRDIFVTSEGADTVTDFQLGTDFIDLDGTGISNLADLLNASSDTGNGASIQTGSGSITLEGISVGQFNDDAFIFDTATASVASSASTASVNLGASSGAGQDEETFDFAETTNDQLANMIEPGNELDTQSDLFADELSGIADTDGFLL